MAELGNVLAVVLAVNLMLWLGQVAALELNPDGPVFYDCNDGMIGSFDANHCAGTTYAIDDSNPGAQLPNAGSEVDASTGNVFTDTFSATINWFTESTGLKYLYNVLSAPKHFLEAINVPNAFAFGISAMWYGFTLLTIIAFALGRDY